MKELKKTYSIELYSNYRIHVVVTDNFAESIKSHCKGLKINVDNCAGLFIGGYDNKYNQGWIFLDQNTPTSHVAHEAFHATFRVMTDIGSDLDKESEEPYAYLLGWIVNKCVLTLHAWEKKYPEEESAYRKDDN